MMGEAAGHYAAKCQRSFGEGDQSGKDGKGHKYVVDSSKDFPGVTGDFGEYDLMHVVGYRANRIVMYYSNQLHSGIMTKEGSDNLSCDPKAKHRRTAVSYVWQVK